MPWSSAAGSKTTRYGMHCSFQFLLSWSSGRLVVWSFGRLVVWSSGRLVVWSFGRLVVWSFGRFEKTKRRNDEAAEGLIQSGRAVRNTAERIRHTAARPARGRG